MAKSNTNAPENGAGEQKEAAKATTAKATVVTEFRDKDNFDKVYEVGDTIELAKERIKDLVSLGLVEAEKPVDPPKEEDPK